MQFGLLQYDQREGFVSISAGNPDAVVLLKKKQKSEDFACLRFGREVKRRDAVLCYCCEFVYYLTGATFITTSRSGKLLTAQLFLIRLSSSSSAAAVTGLVIKEEDEGRLRDNETRGLTRLRIKSKQSSIWRDKLATKYKVDKQKQILI